MRAKILLRAILLLAPFAAANAHLDPAKVMKPTVHERATATVTVQHSDAKPYDETAKPTLKELTLEETFTGDLNGKSRVKALQISYENGSATMTSLQRFIGTLGSRKGTFVLQGSEVIENGRIHATWFVVPHAGTDEFIGLRGEGGFEGDFGQGSQAHLEYWFE